MGVDAAGIGAVAFGSVFLYAGIRGISVGAALTSVVKGTSPASVPQTAAITGTPAAALAAAGTAAIGAGGSASGSAIASDALKYVGQGYIFGGPSSPGRWDCSSFVNYVLGHDLGLPIPGGSWASVTANGTQHGPSTLGYLLFGSEVSHAEVQPGDLAVSVDHMGIIISATQMVSAQDPADGTGIGNFPAGFPAGPPVYRRVT
ncbi:MAG TPA: NlpC/P60 family protein [Streptosporangiaceae bacterium]|nr:NlpC/P60 family protein [Streptosporangiaceae bacterium]